LEACLLLASVPLL